MENTTTKSSKRFVAPIILATLLVGGAIWGYTQYQFGQHHEVTDNAQLDCGLSPVLPRVTGYVNDLRIQDNQRIQKGDTLLMLDDHDFRIKVTQAQMALEAAKANLAAVRANVSAAKAGLKPVRAGVETAGAGVQTAGAGIETAKASIETAKANAEAAKVRVWKTTQDYNRYKKLFDEQSITKQQLDGVQAEKETAEAQLSGAQKQIEVAQKQLIVAQSQQTTSQKQAQGSEAQYEANQQQVSATSQQIQVAEAVVKQREADVEAAQLSLSYTAIVAPMSGVVSKKNVQLGQFIQAGQPVCSITNDSTIWVIANFKETQLEHIREGQTVEVKVDAYPTHLFEGKVLSISAATGAKFALLPPDNSSGNFVKVVQRVPIKIAITSPLNKNFPLRAGMNVRSTVNID